jgi:hypothetical protein
MPRLPRGERALTSTERSQVWRSGQAAKISILRAALESVLQCRSLGQARSTARDALAAVPANARTEREKV